ncbi:MAG: hypothetical protein AUJ31_00210 [Parcubacteria group bacterium CG1_02_39_15]|nr:MAG: hypothetical protein AUJ31_00210 [Parcubacteria group bacterium CG1_02_39_15]
MTQLNENEKERLIQIRKSALRWYIIIVYPTVAAISFLAVGIAKSLDWPAWTWLPTGLTGGVVVMAIGLAFFQPIFNRIRRLLAN